MATYVDETFGADRVIELDGNAFKQCLFDHCTIVFRGEHAPTMLRNTFVRCEWQFIGKAQVTMTFIRSMHADHPEVVGEWLHVFD